MPIAPVLAVAILLIASVAPAQPLEPSARLLDFGTVVGAESAERTFAVANPGSQPVRILNVQLTPPLSVARMKAVVPPGQSIDIVVRLGNPRPAGKYEGQLSVGFVDPNREALVLDVNANLVPAIEFLPRPELIAVTSRGVEARDSVEIVNHLAAPLHLTGGTVSRERFSTTLETLEAGRRYRLSLLLTGRGNAGRQIDHVTLETNQPDQPQLKVRVRTSLKERVYSFPDKLEFGRLPLSSSSPEQLRLRDTSIMVYQKDGTDFQVRASTDVPFLVLRPEKSTMFADRWQIFCSIDPAGLRAGAVSGSITIETNDLEFPTLVVPVEAVVE